MLFGKLPHKPQPLAPSMSRLWLGGELPTAPLQRHWTLGLQLAPMFMNDVLGCCTWAAFANRLRILTKNLWDEEYVLPDDALKAGYLAMTGGRDVGLYNTDVMTHFASQGIQLPGRQWKEVLSAWCSVDHTSLNEMRLAVSWFQVIHGGFTLPKIASILFEEGSAWDIPAGQQLIGEWAPADGHEIASGRYTPDGFYFWTWGREVFVSNAFMAAYMDECQAGISPLNFQTTGLSLDQIDMNHAIGCMDQIREAA